MDRIPIQRLKKILEEISTRKVLVVGDAMLDRYVWGTVSRISPEAPVPVVQIQSETSRLGGAANVANNVKALGASCSLVCVVGEDEASWDLERGLEAQGIPVDGLIKDSSRPTTVKTRVIAHNQQVVRTDREVTDEISGKVEDCLLDLVMEKINDCDAVIVSDYAKGVITKRLLETLIPAVRAQNKLIAVDPKEVHFKNYRRVSLITPNQFEAAAAMGKRIHDEASLHEVGWEIVDLLDVDALLITRGEQGMSLFQKGRVYKHYPTVARKVYDVTGAGDTVISCFTLALCVGASFDEAASIANHAAGIVISNLGTAVVTPDELISSFLELGGQA